MTDKPTLDDRVQVETAAHPERTAAEVGLFAGLLMAGVSRWTKVGKPFVMGFVVAVLVGLALVAAFSLRPR